MQSRLIGQVIDDYRILEMLGQGGMGIVYKAMDTKLDRMVALKTIGPGFASNEVFLKRFQAEARALAKLENPNIVSVFALRETDIGLLLVMEYVDGMTLTKMLALDGPMLCKKACPLFKQFVHAIGHAHRSGIIHRDIKPSNVMVTKNGKVKVTDFGLAKIQQSQENTSSRFWAAGTLPYMSPEQVKGLGNADRLSDIYSIGMTFYEVLTGRLPFTSSDKDFEICRRIVEGDIPSPDELNPTIPAEMVKIVNKAIEKEPTNRYQSAEEMLEAVERFEARHRTLNLAKLPALKESRGRLLISMTGSVALLVVMALAWILIDNRYSRPGLSIVSHPAGATIFLNGDSVGVTPVGVPSKKYRKDERVSLYLTKRGYLSIDTSFVVEKDLEATIPFRLQPAAKVTIQVNPPAGSVAIDGKTIAPSRLASLDLAAGPHQFLISANGYRAKNATINLAEGSNQTLVYKLEQLPSNIGAITIISKPSKASVWLNGKKVGETPYSDNNLLPDSYQLRLSRDGYKDYATTVTVRSGQLREVNAPLAEIGSLRIVTRPAGASVILDDRDVGLTPRTIKSVEVGKHKIVLRKKGYRDVAKTVEVRQRQEVPIKVDLVALSGRIKLLINPPADIYIDGKLFKKNERIFSTDLSAGEHQLKVIHPSLGAVRKKFVIALSRQTYENIDLNKKYKLTVSATPVWGEIFVDGISRGNTPKELKLSWGDHTITVVRESYVTTPQNFTIENDIPKPIQFTLSRMLKNTLK